MKAGLCVLLLTLAACAGTPPQEASTSVDAQYREDDARIRKMEEFAELRAACHRAGRILAVKRHSASRLTPPMQDVDTATCW